MTLSGTPRLQKNWDIRAASNFIFGGSGSGLIAVSALAAFAGQREAAALPMAAGMVLVALGLSLVWLEIGKPWRGLNVFFHPHTSWMSRESIVAIPLVGAAAAGAWFAVPVVMGIAGVLALAFLYCQARMLYAARAIPAWRQAEIVPVIVATGLAEGAGLFLAARHEATWIAGFALAACILREGAWAAYFRGVAHSDAPAASLAALSSPEVKALRLVQLIALAGLAVSLAVGASAWIAFAGLVSALTGWGMKAALITRTAYTCGAAIPFAPARGRGAGRALG